MFFLGVLTPLEALTYLETEAVRAAAQHEELKRVEAVVDWGDDPLSVNGRLALEYGLRFSAMREEWARWAAERIQPPDEPGDTAQKRSAAAM